MQRNNKIKKYLLYYVQATKDKEHSLEGKPSRKITVKEADIMHCHFIITVECK